MFPKMPTITAPLSMAGRQAHALSEDTCAYRVWLHYRTSNVPDCVQQGQIVSINNEDPVYPDPENSGRTDIGDDYLAGVASIVRFPTDHDVFLRMTDGRYIRLNFAQFALDQSGGAVALGGCVVEKTFTPPSGESFVGFVSGQPVNEDLSLWGTIEDTDSLSSIGIGDPDTVIAMPYLADIFSSAVLKYGGLTSAGQLATLTTKTSVPTLTDAKRLLLWDAASDDVSWALYIDTSNKLRAVGSSDFSDLDGTEIGMVVTGTVEGGWSFPGIIYTDVSGIIHLYANGKDATLTLTSGEQLVALAPGFRGSPVVVTNLHTYEVEYNIYSNYGPVGPRFGDPGPVTGPPPGVSADDFLGGDTYLDGNVLRGAVIDNIETRFVSEVMRLSEDADNLSISIDEYALRPFIGLLGPSDMCGAVDLEVDGTTGFFIGGVDYATNCDADSWAEVAMRNSFNLDRSDHAVEYMGAKRGRYIMVLPYTSHVPIEA